MVKNSPANAGDTGDTGSIPRVGKIPWRRAWQPTPLFLPGESYGQRSLAGHSPKSRKKSDRTEHTQLIHNIVLVLGVQHRFNIFIACTSFKVIIK